MPLQVPFSQCPAPPPSALSASNLGASVRAAVRIAATTAPTLPRLRSGSRANAPPIGVQPEGPRTPLKSARDAVTSKPQSPAGQLLFKTDGHA